MYWFVVDIFMAAVIIIMVIVSAHRGFLTSLIRLLGVIISIVAAVVVSRLLAEPIFNGWFRNSMIDSISEKIAGATNPAELLESIEGGLLGILIGVFGDRSALSEFITGFGKGTAGDVATAIVDSVIKEPMVSLISMVLFILTFILVLIVVSIIVKATGVLNVVPIIGGINRFLGAIFGVFYGIGLCYIAVAIFAFFFLITGNSAEYIKIIEENTVFFSWLLRFNPVILF